MADVLTQVPVAAHVGHAPQCPPPTRHTHLPPLITASAIRSPPSRSEAPPAVSETAHPRHTEELHAESGVESTALCPCRQFFVEQQDDEAWLPDPRSSTSNDAQRAHDDDHLITVSASVSDAKPDSRVTFRHVDRNKRLPSTPEGTMAAPSQDSDTTLRQSRYDDLADAFMRDPPRLSSPTPPPVPPKPAHASTTRAVSILQPLISHEGAREDGHHTSYTVSEPAHGSLPSASTSPSNVHRGYFKKTFAPRHSTDAGHDYPSRLSWADRASLPIYRHSFMDGQHMPSSSASMSAFSESASNPSHHMRRKLRKPRPASTIAISSSSPNPGHHCGSSLWRVLSHRRTTMHASAQYSSTPILRSSGSFFRILRSTSERTQGDPSAHTARVGWPPVLTRHSGGGSGQSHSHSSTTSHSTALFSSPSESDTPATTPELVSPASPLVVPLRSEWRCGDVQKESEIVPIQLSHRMGSAGRKLKKRRPSESLPRTTEPSPDISGWRKSRTETTQLPSAHPSKQNVCLPPISPVSPFGLDIPKEFTAGRQLAFPPAPKRKSSTNALGQLAWTGLSSSELAALTSRLHTQRQSPECVVQVGNGKQVHVYEEAPLGSFDPYAESLYARGGNPKLEDGDDASEGKEGGSSVVGHAVNTLSTMRRRVVSMRVDTQAPSNLTRPNPRAHNVHSPGPSSPLSPTRTDAQPARKSASFLESDPMAMRRWTLAMADVPDEVLVQELDKLRKGATARKARSTSRTPADSENGHRTESNCSASSPSSWRPGVHFRLGADSDSEGDDDADGDDEMLEGFENEADEEEWKTARRALLCCRELVRTERNYQVRLEELMNARSSHPFFSLLLSYVPALLRASEALLVRLVDDPSAWGVGAAFIGCEEELEAAFVAWCGVVGNFYVDGDDKDKRGWKGKKSSEEVVSAHGQGDVRQRVGTLPMGGFASRSLSQSGLPDTTTKPRTESRRMSLFGARDGGMFTAALSTGLAYGLSSPHALDPNNNRYSSTASVGKDHGPSGTLTRTLSAWKRKSMPGSLSNLPTSAWIPTSSSHHGHGKEDKSLTVRELAIEPSQRVMRYVLQYKDLLAHTPAASPSRGLVERALESAVRIAKKCDRAQGNSAFLR